jgi:hypothetical protein
MRRTGGGKQVKYNKMDFLILDILGKNNRCVQVLEVVFRLMGQLQISSGHNQLHPYCQLIYSHHPVSEMKRGMVEEVSLNICRNKS